MTSPFIVVDMRALLDDSGVGREASRILETRWNEAAAKARKMHDQARAAPPATQPVLTEAAVKFERETEQALEDSRNGLRRQVLARAQEHIREAATQRNVTTVLDRGSVVLCAREEDVTPEVIAKIDAMGPLQV